MLTGVILAGGQNRRMGGKVKALLPIDGKMLIHYQIDEMKKICSEIIVVVNDPKPFLRVLDPSIKIITDYIAGKGPLSGMHAALSLAKYNTLWIVASDMPFISHEAALFMWEKKSDFDAVIPHLHGKLHPLHGIYDKNCLKPITNMLNKGEYRLSELTQRINCNIIHDQDLEPEIDKKFVINMNTPDDYESVVSFITASMNDAK